MERSFLADTPSVPFHASGLVLAVVALAAILTGCSHGDGLDRETFQADGRTYTVTDCPAAANLLVGGYESADALPVKGQTDRQRVESLLDAARDYYSGPTYAGVNLVRRSGEVWYRLDNGDHAVERADDYQLEVLLESVESCPTTPASWNGIPLLYNVEEQPLPLMHQHGARICADVGGLIVLRLGF